MLDQATMLRSIASHDPGYEQQLRDLARRASQVPEAVEQGARAVLSEVRSRGDAAVRDFTQRFEQRSIGALELSADAWKAGARSLPVNLRASLARAADRIRRFHERERMHMPGSFEYEEDGIRLASRVSPLERVGLYVPGGTARYPSTVLMTAIVARVAGVKEVVMTTPGPSAETLVAAEIAGVDRVFVIGGAQAIAALAYGTESVPRVDKIVGPGNAYVAAAKRLCCGDVGIDMVAGPTEVAIVADSSAEPAWVAADLLAQAEHDEMALPILIAVGPQVAPRVGQELTRQLATLPRRAIAERALRDNGIALVVDDLEQALHALNRIAPEHAGLAVTGADLLADRVVAGAVFVGHHASEAVGDYLAGPSHVLPTGGSARFSSPLGVADFLKRTSTITYSAEALEQQIDDVVRLAEAEGLHGHGRAVMARRKA
jgi:histidinol dehydrogenase